MEKMKRTSPRNKAFGFTLVELVIVIAVIAILAAVLIPTFVGVIDSANNSADVQLAANLNSTLAAEVQLNSNVAASAQNIRFKAKDYGFEAENLATKKSDNVIVYNKNNGRFEVLDVSDIKPEQLVPAYYAEEVIDGYIIVSTKGNDLAEALYDLSNLPSETAAASIANISAIQPAMASSGIMPIASTASEAITKHVQNALNRIDNSEILAMVSTIVESTIYINDNGEMFVIGINNEDGTVIVENIETKDIENAVRNENIPNQRFHSRVVFSDNISDEFDIAKLMQTNTALQVIIPDNVKVKNTYEGLYDDMPTFYGNIDSSINLPSNKINSSPDNAKEIIQQGDEAPILYNADQVYTSDFNGSFVQALGMAEKIHNLEGKEQATIRLVVNGNVEISTDVTIPSYVDVQIPFALGNSFAKEIMTYHMGNMLGEKPLGSAYPANDAENLNKENDKDKLYYLCGEGPGNGYDVMLGNYLAGFSDKPDDFNEEKSIALFKASRNISNEDAEYSLTVSQSATLNVEGNLTVGAVIGYSNAGGYQGHTSGAHGQIYNNGIINVNQGGVLDVFGFVTGEGEVNANEGGLIFEPFIVTDYLDTINTLLLYPFSGFPLVGIKPDIEKNIFNSPFMRYAVQNIQNRLTMNYGSSLYGRVNLMVFGTFLYCRADAPLITSDNYVYDPTALEGKGKYVSTKTFDGRDWKNLEGTKDFDSFEQGGTYFKTIGTKRYMATNESALQMTAANSSIVCTYDGEKTIEISKVNSEQYEYDELSNRNSFAGDIGVVTIELNGNVTTSGIKIDILGGAVTIEGFDIPLDFTQVAIPINTGLCNLSIPYNFNFKINGTLTVSEGTNYVLMPGSKFAVAKSGAVTIEKNAGLYALGTYDNSEYLRSWGETLTSMSESGQQGEIVKADEDGYYYLKTLDDLGSNNILLIVQRIMYSLNTFAPKYYPSAMLLDENGFDTSAKFIVDGKITVEENGDLGGTITAGENATIKLESGAKMGKVLNLGGPYDSNSDFFGLMMQTFTGDPNIQDPDLKQLGMLLTALGANWYYKSPDSLPFLTAVYTPCYLSVVNNEGKEVDIATDDYENSQNDLLVTLNSKVTVIGTSSLLTATNEGDKGIKIVTGARTAAKEITIDSSAISAASKDHVVDDTVAYFKFESDTLTLTDNKQAE